LAAYFVSKGSTRLHRWLREHPRFGCYVRDGEDAQVIPPIGKYASTLLTVPAVGHVVLTRDLSLVLSGSMVVTVALVLWYNWSRRSQRS